MKIDLYSHGALMLVCIDAKKLAQAACPIAYRPCSDASCCGHIGLRVCWSCHDFEKDVGLVCFSARYEQTCQNCNWNEAVVTSNRRQAYYDSNAYLHLSLLLNAWWWRRQK